jgi:DNA-binding NtrC family response regulator
LRFSNLATNLGQQLVNSAPRKTIVIVDDEKSYADLITQLLKDNLDCNVHVFYRPADALAAIGELNPGVIVTDYYMPEINGFDFIRRASVLLPETAFVLITGHNMSASIDEIASLPAIKGHLSKPFGWRQLAVEVLGVWPDNSPPKLRSNASLKT